MAHFGSLTPNDQNIFCQKLAATDPSSPDFAGPQARHLGTMTCYSRHSVSPITSSRRCVVAIPVATTLQQFVLAASLAGVRRIPLRRGIE